ncbi:hypothetical protein EMIHUDRAFT_215011 [Emiliania huxleyi CCMP1516]|nr:hypothetical protein EMIHUDRAFT_215011 [Emiliania huxleyi CCMP1516]EOD11159.1 hypothetical protein EMIHUDRAFT_215011 [Emiliania huxleyi CCMP1516]|eukprot:XP_005763588.1 hypothetical protein EMIHUDRAFT_215011 [Emiliania huxleyi CCMP1516]
MVTVLGMPGQAGGECAELLSFKGHKGWVGNVQFAGDQRLLSAANDGQLVLWDLSKARGGRPRLISQLEPQSGGIFAMHEAGGRVLTASKDGTVALSMLADDCLRPGASWDELHSGVIKSVCWRDGNVFASAGRGGNLRVVDPRAGDPSAGLLLSAGYDLQIKLWDARAPSRPLHTLQGHVAPRVARQKGIFQPQFCAGGRYVVASGEGSEALSLYSAESGATLSRGRIGCTASTLSCVSVLLWPNSATAAAAA